MYRGNSFQAPRWIVAVVLVVSLSSCATYYQKNIRFQQAFEAGRPGEAHEILNKNDKFARGNNRLLYFLNQGVTLQMMGNYKASNEYLEKAYIFLQNYKSNYSFEALSLLSNPGVIPYTGEDHEKVLIHYYKALNFLMMNQPDQALVEARRINIALHALNDQYKGRSNVYKDDAFAHVLMGLAYEQDRDFNNAFIAYRNAYNIYRDVYLPHYGMAAPEQLKQDLLRTAYLNGFREELETFEREFGRRYQPEERPVSELVLFWHNGTGPVKEEWSINFGLVKGEGGTVLFENDELGLSFPFFTSDADAYTNSDFGDLKVVRVAFPKYRSSGRHYDQALLQIDSGETLPVEPVENLQQIAVSVLRDRMLREMSTALLRLAAKQAAEHTARSENDELGALVSLINAFTEKADTRNWQTLPHSIGYARAAVAPGAHRAEVKVSSGSTEIIHSFDFEVKPGESYFQLLHSL